MSEVHDFGRMTQRRRLRLDLTGAVQGVGFRPFAHRLATQEGLAGFVRNTGEGVSLEVEGDAESLERFCARLEAEIWPPAAIHGQRRSSMPPQGASGFVIASSAMEGGRPAMISPDLASCPECVEEIFDLRDRRHRYAFTSCTRCGPRYTIVEASPYDRMRTSMQRFAMCAACEAEYRDPTSRRFHAEIIACAACGPRLALLGADGAMLEAADAALIAASAAVAQGQILALKGIGGFQLVVDARNSTAVARLRLRKRRPAKPFALMVATLAEAAALAHVNEAESKLLASSAAPIVLLRSRPKANGIATNVAPENPWLGIMLPSTPLHHLLLRELGFPIVATSGNRFGEPLVTDEAEALQKLRGIADLFLVHDRPILRPIDDSVMRIIDGRETALRCARGYSPQLFPLPAAASSLGLGAQQKVAIALDLGGAIVLGPYIGDMAAAETRAAQAKAVEDMTRLYRLRPERIVCDAHPGYLTSRVAERMTPEPVRVSHHLAHVLACMLDNGLDGPVLGVAWDGSGHGADATSWGGEFLLVDDSRWRRFAHFLPFRLPGGEASIREPRRTALGALHAIFGDALFDMTELAPVAAFDPGDRSILARMLASHFNAPLTTSAGRLFDAVASILGLCQKMSFEGEAAMSVEFAADRAAPPQAFSAIEVVDEAKALKLDWRPMVSEIISAHGRGVSIEASAAGFHAALANAVVAVARRAGKERVLLTGGCFQNRHLAERAIAALRRAGFRPYWHRRIPPNDGGIAVGQAAFAARPRLLEED